MKNEVSNQNTTFSASAIKRYIRHHLWAPLQLQDELGEHTGIILVIPSYREDDWESTLNALLSCTRTSCGVEVLYHLNGRSDDPHFIKNKFTERQEAISAWMKRNSSRDFRFHLLTSMNLPAKKAGVGLARKIAMDEALFRFIGTGRNGLIVNLDADCRVSRDYLTGIERYFRQHQDVQAASIYFEHPLQEVREHLRRQLIVRYELFLRYYVHGLRYAGYPFCHHTVGSAMACRAAVYLNQGGMNTRKAGEDFYFLHKMMRNEVFGTITDGCVYPSSRPSDRVPFGTGAFMATALQKKMEVLETYPAEAFSILREFITKIPVFYEEGRLAGQKLIRLAPSALRAFLEDENFQVQVEQAIQATRHYASFEKRFYQWFDGLKVLKIVHYLSDQVLKKTDITLSAAILLEFLGHAGSRDPEELLATYRRLDRRGGFKSYPPGSNRPG